MSSISKLIKSKLFPTIKQQYPEYSLDLGMLCFFLCQFAEDEEFDGHLRGKVHSLSQQILNGQYRFEAYLLNYYFFLMEKNIQENLREQALEAGQTLTRLRATEEFSQYLIYELFL